MKTGNRKELVLKIIIVWLAIILLGGFLVSSYSSRSPVTLSVMPDTPREGDPLVAAFILGNPTAVPLTTSYQLFMNGALVEQGKTVVAAGASTKYHYVCGYSLERGEQVNFLLKTDSDLGAYSRAVSLPAYPPQLMSSFVSFAAFSTSVMSSMISIEYFDAAFGTAAGVNTGIILVIVLVTLLVFLELAQGMVLGRRAAVIGRYRISFASVSTILIIIFLGMVFTKIVMIVAS